LKKVEKRKKRIPAVFEKERNSFLLHISVRFEDEQHHEMIDYDKLQRLKDEGKLLVYCVIYVWC
jgi:hypothetical protein